MFWKVKLKGMHDVFKTIIFDFDGVILESFDIKTKAFLNIYP